VRIGTILHFDAQIGIWSVDFLGIGAQCLQCHHLEKQWKWQTHYVVNDGGLAVSWVLEKPPREFRWADSQRTIGNAFSVSPKSM
jgi:hypothetical protein